MLTSSVAKWIGLIWLGLAPGNQKGSPESRGDYLRASSKSSKVERGGTRQKGPLAGGPRNWKRETGWLVSQYRFRFRIGQSVAVAVGSIPVGRGKQRAQRDEAVFRHYRLLL